MAIKAPFLPYSQLSSIASRFLGEHHPSRSIPIPIEEIVEFAFEIDIVPTPGLDNGFDIDSYLSSDCKEIHVDEYVYRHQPSRYRFSLAHELSHVLIHKDIFSQFKFQTTAEWKAAVQGIPADQYSWIEWQAYSLAGLILVPPEELSAEFEAIANQAWLAGVDLHDASDYSRRIAESNLGKKFGVSRAVIEKRMRKDKLWD